MSIVSHPGVFTGNVVCVIIPEQRCHAGLHLWTETPPTYMSSAPHPGLRGNDSDAGSNETTRNLTPESDLSSGGSAPGERRPDAAPHADARCTRCGSEVPVSPSLLLSGNTPADEEKKDKETHLFCRRWCLSPPPHAGDTFLGSEPGGQKTHAKKARAGRAHRRSRRRLLLPHETGGSTTIIKK